MQLLATNPADVVVPPRVVRGEMMALDEKQSAQMLRDAEGTSLHMPLLLAVGTGMRRGELLGLRWSDVDLKAGTATVNQTLQEAFGELHCKEPKTTKSRRRITLPGLVVEALRARRAEQARNTLACEPGWSDSEFVLAVAPGDPRTATASGGASRRSRASPAVSMICAIRTRPSCSRWAFTPRSSPNASVTPPSVSPWTRTAM